jgi:hypothetical protein
MERDRRDRGRLRRAPSVRPEAAPRPPQDRPRRRDAARPCRLPRLPCPLAAEALRPAETTDAWTALRTGFIEPRAIDASLSGATYLLAHNEREEALAVAIAVREALETPGATVAVVTPDRALARRVSAELGRWGLKVDDSAGARLDLMPEGVFARLLAEALAEPAEPARLLPLASPAALARIRATPDGARVLELAGSAPPRPWRHRPAVGTPRARIEAEARTRLLPGRAAALPYDWGWRKAGGQRPDDPGAVEPRFRRRRSSPPGCRTAP